ISTSSKCWSTNGRKEVPLLLPAPVIPLPQISPAVSAENLWDSFIATAREVQANFRHLAAFVAPPPDGSRLRGRAFQRSASPACDAPERRFPIVSPVPNFESRRFLASFDAVSEPRTLPSAPRLPLQ